MIVRTTDTKIIFGVLYPKDKDIEVSDNKGQFLIDKEGFEEIKEGKD